MIWKRMRRVVDEVLNKTLAPSFYPAQEEEAVRLVWNMLQSAGYKQWDSEIQRQVKTFTQRSQSRALIVNSLGLLDL
ncbi:hypothetical protein AAF712_012038 [Marasmius tenuissimus]|uniref:Uncharacterized protein n=1 Tax=Marasmius tenuissimus TaxID=585030 RepID=A0ABR2ZIN3_9AGAR